MSNSKSAINEIKSLLVQFGFMSDSKAETVKEVFVDAKLKDGTEIKVSGEGLSEGLKVVVVTEEGEIPAPDGIHELEDGTKVETKEGIISKIEKVMEVEVEDEEVKKEELGDYPKKEEVGQKKEEMEKEMVELVKEFISKMGEKISMIEKKVEDMSVDFNSFKKEPAAKKIADGKTEKFNKVDDAMDSKLQTIAALRKTNK
jgi:hypothetical protein